MHVTRRRHQQRALTFMKQRESGLIPEKYRLWKKATINGQEWYDPQPAVKLSYL